MNVSAETINKSEKYIKEGFKAVWPICVGYVPLGIAMGVLGQKAMLSPLQVLSMSLFVFAGSGQFIAVSMISGGAHAVSIIMTVFMINLRHLLMSSSLCVYMKNVSPKKLTMLSYGIVDETFAVNIEKLKKGQWGPRRSIAVNFFAYSAWALSTFTGCYFGEFIPEGSFGIDYALTAMFICLLVFQLNGSIYFITAVISGLIAVFLAMTLPGNSYIVISSIIAAFLGVIIKKRIIKNDE
jgi:4-azaleucine resistance transporter AzlC